MLMIILIGAALTHTRPEPPDKAERTDPEPQQIKGWRICAGVAAFWR